LSLIDEEDFKDLILGGGMKSEDSEHDFGTYKLSEVKRVEINQVQGKNVLPTMMSKEDDGSSDSDFKRDDEESKHEDFASGLNSIM
jgi:hypothetical protein